MRDWSGRQGGHQMLVWIGRTSGGVPFEDFGAALVDRR
jgi:hypothetical protein